MKFIKNYLNNRKNNLTQANLIVSNDYTIKYRLNNTQVKSYTVSGTCIQLKKKKYDPIISILDNREKKFPYVLSIPLNGNSIESITKIRSNNFFGKANNKYYIKHKLWER